MDFKQVEKKYRPIPFWSWNEKLDPEETKRQIGLMDDAGIGGYFMHARGGLLTEYMGEEWFENVKAATEEGEKRGMGSWAYDENGWPSGFGGGKVNGKGEFYQQKYLGHVKVGEPMPKLSRVLTEIGGEVYFYEINPYYVDVLDSDVIADFIKEVYEVYYEKFGNKITGIFTDEPQMMNGMGKLPWSNKIEEKFTARYGYSLTANLNSLFYDEGDFKKIRFDYYKLLADTFSASYFKQIYDWCTAHGYAFTGHEMMEDNLGSQLTSSAVAMPHYEYFTVPGMDWLGREIYDCLIPMQLGSACAQLGKKQVLSETFALAGHNVTHDELKRVFEWQMVRGVNLLCTHLEGYSLRGIRKRDYPPAMYYQQPWWEDMKVFFDAMSRIGKLIAEGEITADTLLIHPQSTAWLYACGKPGYHVEKIMEFNNALLADMHTLEDKHVKYHFGDETLMERHGKVENGKLIIGKMAYSTVVMPKHEILFPNTEKLLAEFVAQGGKIVTADEVPVNPVCEVNKLTYTERSFPEYNMHYFVNTTRTVIDANITVGNFVMDPVTGDLTPFGGNAHFGAFESLVLIEDKTGKMKPDRAAKPLPEKNLALPEKMTLENATMNSITLDFCDYSFDGELIAKNGYVLDILPRLNELRRPVRLHQTYRFRVETVPEVVYLCMETPELFTAELNGKKVPGEVCGFFRDKSFKLLNIAGLVKTGENVLDLEGTICQSEKTFHHLSNSWTCETMKNSLAYDEEVEQIYIVGNFGARVNETPEEIPDQDAYRIMTYPTITAAPTEVKLSSIDQSGYPEFSGTLTLNATVEVDDMQRKLVIEKSGINAVGVKVNGKDLGTKLFPPYVFDCSDALTVGKNTLTLTLRGNLRNMQGPFHLKEGESGRVAPGSFYRESEIFSPCRNADESCHDVLGQWDDRTCLCHVSIQSK